MAEAGRTTRSDWHARRRGANRAHIDDAVALLRADADTLATIVAFRTRLVAAVPSHASMRRARIRLRDELAAARARSDGGAVARRGEKERTRPCASPSSSGTTITGSFRGLDHPAASGSAAPYGSGGRRRSSDTRAAAPVTRGRQLEPSEMTEPTDSASGWSDIVPSGERDDCKVGEMSLYVPAATRAADCGTRVPARTESARAALIRGLAKSRRFLPDQPTPRSPAHSRQKGR